MTQHLAMQVRSVSVEERTIEGICVPYNETTYRVPGGERIQRGAFKRSILNRGDKVPLCRGHSSDLVYGYSRSFTEADTGLLGDFVVNPGEQGDHLLDEVRDGYLPAMSVCFEVTRNGVVRGDDGIPEVREAKLIEVSLVGIPAYEGAAVTAVRTAQDLDALLAPFQNIPKWDLDPLPPLRYRYR